MISRRNGTATAYASSSELTSRNSGAHSRSCGKHSLPTRTSERLPVVVCTLRPQERVSLPIARYPDSGVVVSSPRTPSWNTSTHGAPIPQKNCRTFIFILAS